MKINCYKTTRPNGKLFEFSPSYSLSNPVNRRGYNLRILDSLFVISWQTKISLKEFMNKCKS